MLIAFDGTTLTPGRTGVGYYTEHLLQHLAREVVNTGDEIVVVSNKPIDTQSPLPRHVRVHDGHRFPVRIGWMQLRAVSALGALRPDVAHFTNGMMPTRISRRHRRHRARHEPAPLSELSSGSARPAQPAVDACRHPTGLVHRDRVQQRETRSAAASRRGAGSRRRRSRSREPGVPADRGSAAVRGCPRPLRPPAPVHALRRDDRAAKEPDAADDGLRRCA